MASYKGTPEEGQNLVNDIAQKFSDVEKALMKAMEEAAGLPAAIADYHAGLTTHWSHIPYAEAAMAQGKIGEALAVIFECHKKCEALRKAWEGLPKPDAVILNGGGGCKPVC